MLHKRIKSSEIKKGKTLSDFIERSGIFSFYCFDPGVSFNKLKKIKENMYFSCVCKYIGFTYVSTIYVYRRTRWFCIYKKK